MILLLKTSQLVKVTALLLLRAPTTPVPDGQGPLLLFGGERIRKIDVRLGCFGWVHSPWNQQYDLSLPIAYCIPPGDFVPDTHLGRRLRKAPIEPYAPRSTSCRRL